MAELFEKPKASKRKELPEGKPAKKNTPRQLPASSESTVHSGRVPPNAIDVEQKVLGSTIVNGASAVRILMRFLDEHDFYKPTHQRLFRAAVILTSEGRPVDAVTMVDQLSKMPDYQASEDPVTVTEATLQVGSLANLEYYAKIILEKSIMRAVIVKTSQVASEAYTNTMVADELLDELRQFEQDTRVRLSTSYTHHINKTRDELINHLRDLRLGKSMNTRKFYLHDLDRKTGGMNEGNLIVISGPAKSGKTSFALQVGVKNAENGVGVQIFSQEMTADELLLRCALLHCEISWLSALSGKLVEHEWNTLAQAVDMVSQLPIYVNDRMNTLGVIESELEMGRTNHKIGLAIVDYIQIINVEGKFDTREREVSALSSGLKKLAKVHRIPIIALSQVNDDFRTRESRGIEMDLDKHIIIKREEPKDMSPIVPVELSLTQRMAPSGGFGAVTLGYKLINGSFVNLTDERKEPDIFQESLPLDGRV